MDTDRIAAITIRRLTEDDRDAVVRLAELDTRRVPHGELLGAEIELLEAELEARLLAAISLSTGETIADPFSQTDELQALLEEARALSLNGHG